MVYFNILSYCCLSWKENFIKHLHLLYAMDSYLFFFKWVITQHIDFGISNWLLKKLLSLAPLLSLLSFIDNSLPSSQHDLSKHKSYYYSAYNSLITPHPPRIKSQFLNTNCKRQAWPILISLTSPPTTAQYYSTQLCWPLAAVQTHQAPYNLRVFAPALSFAYNTPEIIT